MRFVQPNTPEQQAVLHLHHGRHLLVRQRFALSNHMRGVLSEYRIIMPQWVKVISRRLSELLEETDSGLPMLARHLLAELNEEHDQLIDRSEHHEGQIKAWHVNSNVSLRLACITGIGVLTATAQSATVGEGQDFSNGRQLAAYPGLVPRQASSGGKARVLGISKRGDGTCVAC
jgi:transposase